jgi:hypothetical protein
MSIIRAISLTSAVHDWLANSYHPRILHVFDRACNLINERKEVLSIVTPEIGNGPFNLVVEDEVSFSEHVTIESLVSVLGEQITLGGLVIHTGNTSLWDPRPDWGEFHRHRKYILRRVQEIVQEIASSVFNFAPLRSDLLAMTSSQLPVTNYPSPILQSSNSLAASLATADLPASLLAAKQLAGLGIGLTPSGDDFLIGALHAVWILHPREVAIGLAQGVAESAAPLTTSLSAAWLRSAGRGGAGELWHQFFGALVSGNEIEIQKTVKDILAVGETSGADALAGFVGVFLAGYPNGHA